MIATYQRIQDVDAHQLLGSNGHLGCLLYMLQLCQSTSMSPHSITCQNVYRCFSLAKMFTDVFLCVIFKLHGGVSRGAQWTMCQASKVSG
jgi:hypothetical protein